MGRTVYAERQERKENRVEHASRLLYSFVANA